MSFSIVVKSKVGKGIQKKIERSKHTLQYVLCVLYFFFLRGAVLAALFVHCKVRGPHISLSRSQTYYI